MQEFHFVSPKVMLELLKIYTTSFYSSSLWNLCSTECQKLYASWNITIRHVFKLPYRTHNYFIESISGSLHAKTMLWSRFMKFHDSLINNKKPILRLLAFLCEDDERTTHGRNLHHLQVELQCNKTELSSSYIKQNMEFKAVPQDEQWRIPLLLNLLEIKKDSMQLNGFQDEEIDSMIEDVCIN